MTNAIAQNANFVQLREPQLGSPAPLAGFGTGAAGFGCGGRLFFPLARLAPPPPPFGLASAGSTAGGAACGGGQDRLSIREYESITKSLPICEQSVEFLLRFYEFHE